MTNCPPKLRGDLTKWLCEINTGVYVGHVSGRVRDALWERVCQNIKSGSATMVFTAGGEQKMDFRVHNTAWIPVDLDGIKLMCRPQVQNQEITTTIKAGFSNAAKRRMAQKVAASSCHVQESYVIIDLETTGLEDTTDQIIEFGAILVRNGEGVQEFSRLVCCDGPLPQTITELTGLTQAQLQEQGDALPDALADFLAFIAHEKLVGYNISFDMSFLRVACQSCGCPIPTNQCVDLLNIARRKVRGVSNYKLATLAAHFELTDMIQHRALEDCRLIQMLYTKLNQNQT